MKNYVKPELFYERYELTQHIADCAWEYQFQQESCSIKADPDLTGYTGTLFGDDSCEVNVNNMETYCYQNSVEMGSTFMS